MSDAAHYRSLFAHCGAAASVRSLRAAGFEWAVATAPVLGGSARLDHRPGPGRDFDRCVAVARPRLDRDSRNHGAWARDWRGHARLRALVSPGSAAVDRHGASCRWSDGPGLARRRHARAAWRLARELSADHGRRPSPVANRGRTAHLRSRNASRRNHSRALRSALRSDDATRRTSLLGAGAFSSFGVPDPFRSTG
jgi:hypothetical protein